MLDLSPEAQTIVAEAAAREGVSADDLIRRTFAPRAAATPLPAPEPAPTVPAWRPPVVPTSEEQRAALMALMALPKGEIARLNAPSIALLQAHLDAAANATPEEIAEAEAEWLDFQRSINETRHITGEALVYPEAGLP